MCALRMYALERRRSRCGLCLQDNVSRKENKTMNESQVEWCRLKHGVLAIKLEDNFRNMINVLRKELFEKLEPQTIS